jgi:transcriptional regulator with XRE-family HTH domain
MFSGWVKRHDQHCASGSGPNAKFFADLSNWDVSSVKTTLDAVAPRLRKLRRRDGTTLVELAAQTGIPVSTLSRLESGRRRPTLEQVLALAQAHSVSTDHLLGAPPTGDPRVTLRPVIRNGKTLIPLTRRPGGSQAYKLILPGTTTSTQPEPNTHKGYEWLYVLDGRLRLVLADHDLLLSPGEAAEFDTQVPHWFGAADHHPTELLALLGRQGERTHMKARAKATTNGPRHPTTNNNQL